MKIWCHGLELDGLRENNIPFIVVDEDGVFLDRYR